MTVHQLLTHTAGMGDVFGPDFNAQRLELRRHQDYIDRFGKRPLLFEPGQQWMYSNYGFILLGAVIEKVSGQSYYDYVREHVYQPAGMTATGSEPEDQIVPGRAVGYTATAGDERGDAEYPDAALSRHRGGRRLHDRGRPAAVRECAHRPPPARRPAHRSPDGRQGRCDRRPLRLRVLERRVNGVRSFGHGGNAPGMDGALEIFPESGHVVAVLANIDAPAAQRASEFVINRLPR